MILIKAKPMLRRAPASAISVPNYRARLARNADDVKRAQRLRFEVFNLELNEGLAESHFTGLDADPFDPVCDHLIIEEAQTQEVVGTYRLQTGSMAAANHGYYSEREFDFEVYEPLRVEIIELGRACVHKAHRNFSALHLLWRGIAKYALEHQARFLVGCSSLTSQDQAEGVALYEELRSHYLVRQSWQTSPHPPFRCIREVGTELSPKTPKLFRAYLAIGARICGPPAIDREFGTIDFLTLLDLQALPAMVRSHFLA
jgi:putative hemolysin